MGNSPLEGIRILDLSRSTAGAIASMCLGDYGADVLSVTLPGNADGVDAAWPMLSRNKALLELNYLSENGAADLHQLVSRADCLMLDQRESAILDGSLGIHLHEFPRLVTTLVPPFARDADWPLSGESDEFVAALSGVARRQSSHDGGPIESVYEHILYEQGLWAATVTVAALLEREQSGIGQVCEVDGMHGALVASAATMVIRSGDSPDPPTAVGPRGPTPIYMPYICSDGRWIFFAALTPKFQDIGFNTLGIADALVDPRIGAHRQTLYDPDNREWVKARIAAAFMTRPRDVWLHKLEEAGCPAGPLGRREDWLDHPQVIALGLRSELVVPDIGEVVMPGPPIVLTTSPAAVPEAPRIVVSAPSWPEQNQVHRPPVPAAQGKGPLHGIRIIDLGTVLAGPYAGTLLAELGADVIKVETPEGDNFRTIGFQYNRGQRSLAIDLRHPDGHAAFMDLVRTVDAVIDNFRPGVLERLGIDYKPLAAARPGVVTLSISGFGDVGPYAGRPGFDPVLQAMSGMMSAQGGSDEPVFFTLAANDVTAACASALGVCLALFHRARTGEGQYCSTSLVAAATFMQSKEIMRYHGYSPSRVGGRDYMGPSALNRYYPTRDGFLRIRGDSSSMLVRAALGLEDQPASDSAIEGLLTELFANLSNFDALARMSSAGVAAVPARTLRDLRGDAVLIDGKYIEPIAGADGTPVFVPGRYARFSRSERTESILPPGAGEHSRELLTEAGLDQTAIDELLKNKVVIQGQPMASLGIVSYR